MKERNRSRSKPGSGNIWVKGVTKCEEFKLNTENIRHPSRGKSVIKSLQMPVRLKKFDTDNNSQPGNQRNKSKRLLMGAENQIFRAKSNETFTVKLLI